MADAFFSSSWRILRTDKLALDSAPERTSQVHSIAEQIEVP
jgi:hypothetical protein